jgi:hypothetical protein
MLKPKLTVIRSKLSKFLIKREIGYPRKKKKKNNEMILIYQRSIVNNIRIEIKQYNMENIIKLIENASFFIEFNRFLPLYKLKSYLIINYLDFEIKQI